MLALLLAASHAPAGGPSITPPVAKRPPEFSWVVGSYTMRASVDKKEVLVEQPIELTVVIQGKGPKEYQPKLEKLKIFPPDTDNSFFVEPVPEKTQAEPAKGFWVFVYRLRPRTEGEQKTPWLKLWTYNPPRGRYELRTADEIPITVRPPKAKEIVLDLKVIPAPASFFEICSPGNASASIGQIAETAILFGVPIGCGLAYFLWRRRHPDAGRLLARRRSQAANLALALLSRSQRPEEINHAAVAYLRERLDFPAQEATASEVRHFLLKRGAPKTLAKQWESFVQTCAAYRFTPIKPASTERLSHEATALIHASEDQPCWRA